MPNFAFCLDSSETAFSSDDVAGHSRWSFQLQAADLLVKSVPAASHSDADAARGGPAPDSREPIFIAMADKPRVVPVPCYQPAVSLQRELSERIQAGGASNLVKSLRLALLTGRMRKCSHVIVFVASETEVNDGELHELARSLQGAGVGVGIVVLEPELSDAAKCTLRMFIDRMDGALEAGNSSTGYLPPHPASRLVLLHEQAGPATEVWQLLDVVQEELSFPGLGLPPPRGRAASSSTHSSSQRTPSLYGSRGAGGLAPHHRAPLLRGRSGINGPAICRYESLDSLGHLSIDGFMRPWLPSYSNVPKAGPFVCVRQGANELWYLYVYSLPKWRTLAEVGVGRMMLLNHDAPACKDREAAASPAADFAGPRASALPAADPAAALAPLRGVAGSGLAAGVGAEEGSDSGWMQQLGLAGHKSKAQQRQVLVPDTRHGTLRLMQSSVNCSHFKLTWQHEQPHQSELNLFEQAESLRRQVSEEAEWEVKVSSSGSTQAKFLSVAPPSSMPANNMVDGRSNSSVLCVEVCSSRSRCRSTGDTVDQAADSSSTARHFFWMQESWSGVDGERGTEALAGHLGGLVRSPPPIPPEPDLEEAIRDETVQPVKIGPFPSALVKAILDSRLRGSTRGSSGGHGGSKRGHSAADMAGTGYSSAPGSFSQARGAGGCSKGLAQASGSKQMKKLVKPCSSSPELLAGRAGSCSSGSSSGGGSPSGRLSHHHHGSSLSFSSPGGGRGHELLPQALSSLDAAGRAPGGLGGAHGRAGRGPGVGLVPGKVLQRCGSGGSTVTHGVAHGEVVAAAPLFAAPALHCMAPAAAITGQAGEGANVAAAPCHQERKECGEAGHDDSLLFDRD